MENLNIVKTGFYTAIIFIGGILGKLFGGFDMLFYALLILSIVDFISGLIVALVFKNSTKTETGAAQSQVGFKGLAKKVFIYLLIVVAVQVDLVMNAGGAVRSASILGFMANEVLSIIENAGLMGIELPEVIVNAVDILKKKSSGNRKLE